MKIKHLLFAAVITLITVLACQKEMSVTNVPGNPAGTTTVSATITGRITSETGAPVQGALVKAGTATSQTNVNGEFRINNATLAEHNAFVTVEKTGYFTGSRTFIAKAGQNHYIEVQLLPKNNSGSVSTASGGTITLANSSTITLPANSVVLKSTGASYSGTVQIAMAWIDPTAASLYRQMPGDLRGIDETNTERGLQSFGMLAVELTGAGGEALQIAPGKKAMLKFPLPTAISGTAPASIALWSFSDSTGLWKQEGTATKSGNFYTAEVSHFSFWNCDAPFPVVQFSAKLVNQNGVPLQHALVKIRRTSVANSYAGYGYTDSAGSVGGLVPSNEPLSMEVYATSACSQAVYTQAVGPFTAATNLGTITVTIIGANTYTITGMVVNCGNAPVATGYLDISAGNGFYRTPVTNGTFSLTLPGCSASMSVTYYAADSTTSTQSTPVTATLTAGPNALGTITACGLSTQRFINFTLDGTAYSIVSPPDSTRSSIAASQTVISGFKGMGTNAYTSLYTGFSGNSTGTYPLSYLSVAAPAFSDSTTIPPGGINVTVTEYGVAGAYIAGSFTGTLNGTGGATHTIQCSFRVKRN